VLECGAHWPYLTRRKRALAQPACALRAAQQLLGQARRLRLPGLHMMAGRSRAAFLRGYVEPGHPVMREVDAALEAATGARLADAPRGVDGCSIPTYALPLRALALGFARVAPAAWPVAPIHARAAQRLREAVAPRLHGGRHGALRHAVMQHSASACSARWAPRACTARRPARGRRQQRPRRRGGMAWAWR
jgi:L-asparaginase II